MVGGHLEEGDVGIEIFSDNLCNQFRLIRKADFDFRRVADDMVVRDDVSVRIDNDAGTRSGSIGTPFLRKLTPPSWTGQRKEVHDRRFCRLSEVGNNSLHFFQHAEAR